MPSISIIVPVYNAAARLQKCLSGIAAQTVCDFECILINDGSTDNSLEICNEFSKFDPRFVVLDFPNSGPSSARNHGLEVITSPWVTFVDADDTIYPTYLENYLKYNRDDYSVQVIQGYYCEGYDGIDKETIYLSKKFAYTEIDSYSDGSFIDANNLMYNWGVWCKVFSTKILKEHSLRFDPNLKCGEDGLFWHTYLCYIEKLVFVPEQGYKYFCPTKYSSISRLGLLNKDIGQKLIICKQYKEIYPILLYKYNLKEYSRRLLKSLYIDNYFRILLTHKDISLSQWQELKALKPSIKDFRYSERKLIYTCLTLLPLKLINNLGKFVFK